MAKAINDSVFNVSYGPVDPDNAPGTAGTILNCIKTPENFRKKSQNVKKFQFFEHKNMIFENSPQFEKIEL